jgi:predicted TIM-barrel fold metal-dependent hydrolase
MVEAQAASVEDPLAGIRIIDSDAHFTEPADLWSSRAPASMKGRLPEQRTEDGLSAWYLDGEPWSGIGGNMIKVGRERVRGDRVQPFSAVDPSAWDVKERLSLLDEMGIEAQILFPNGVGFASNHIFAIEDVAQRTAVLQIYNDFLLDVQDESDGRLFPQAMLPVWDMDLTLKEMHRMVERGVTGFTLSDKPELLGLPELPEPYFTPMWDLANETGLVLNFHIGAGMKREIKGAANMRDAISRPAETGRDLADMYWQSFGPQRRLAILATQMYMSNVRIIVNLCMSDLFDRYPNVKIMSAESGIGWIPFVMEALDYQFDEMVTDAEELKLQKRRPLEYFHDHIYVSFWFERVGPMKLMDDIGVDNILVETDVPHPTCLYPGAREHFAQVLADIPSDVRRKVLQDNAIDLYQLPIEKSPPPIAGG